MTKTLALLVAAACALPIAEPSNAFHGVPCSAEGATPLAMGDDRIYAFHAVLTPANGFNPNNPVKFRFTLAEGEHYLVAETAADVDLVVCVPGAALNRHACASGNLAFLPEGCGGLCFPGSPGSCFPGGPPLICWGPASCNFVLYLYYCSGFECGYPAQPPVAAIAGVIV